MHQAANVPFERAVHEFVRWCAVRSKRESPAPAWWWGQRSRYSRAATDAGRVVRKSGLPESATYADGAGVFLKCLATRRRCRGPAIFQARRRIRIPLSAIRRATGAGSSTNSISCHLLSSHRLRPCAKTTRQDNKQDPLPTRA